MKSVKEFEFLAKGKQLTTQSGNKCVIYTRVSTKEQAENNMSLDTQRRACELYARKQGYKIMAYFGGTFESAKTDEREEFNHMLSFVRSSREQVSYILVYSVDRFSRSGANAIYIKEQLKQHGISILSVSQPTDVSTPSGSLQQNIQFIFSEYDNQLRREKTVAGMRDKLLRGEWCGQVPRGYDIIVINGKHSIKLNAEAEHIRKAFLWKFYERITNTVIEERLQGMGIKITRAHLSNIFRNPFYCGIITNKLLEGKAVIGKHEKLISKEVFLAVNELINNDYKKGQIKHLHDNIFLPLRRFVICKKCGGRMTGYLALKKNLYYYKCKKIGCGVNINANTIHNLFLEILSKVKYKNNSNQTLKKLLLTEVVNTENINIKSEVIYKGKLTKLKNALDEIEERFVFGKISESMYNKQTQKLFADIKEIEILIDKAKAGLAERNYIKEESEQGIIKIANVWLKGDLNSKRIIQNTIFPDGATYDKALNVLKINGLSEDFYLDNTYNPNTTNTVV